MILHWILQIAVAALVTYLLRATPFILCGTMRETPRWLKAASVYISPVIIFCLIVWCYVGMDLATAAPWVAGALAIALHLWLRNPLIAIGCSTVLYMGLVNGWFL